MKKDIGDKVIYNGKELTIVATQKNFSNNKITYYFDNGETALESDLFPVKKEKKFESDLEDELTKSPVIESDDEDEDKDKDTEEENDDDDLDEPTPKQRIVRKTTKK